MARLAERIGIAMSPVLLEPTFNGRPIRANSAERSRSYGVLGGARAAGPPTRIVAELAGDLYERAEQPPSDGFRTGAALPSLRAERQAAEDPVRDGAPGRRVADACAPAAARARPSASRSATRR